MTPDLGHSDYCGLMSACGEQNLEPVLQQTGMRTADGVKVADQLTSKSGEHSGLCTGAHVPTGP